MTIPVSGEEYSCFAVLVVRVSSCSGKTAGNLINLLLFTASYRGLEGHLGQIFKFLLQERNIPVLLLSYTSLGQARVNKVGN